GAQAEQRHHLLIHVIDGFAHVVQGTAVGRSLHRVGMCYFTVVATALSIAGSDPSGGAGIQADLKTFHQFGVYGEAVITLLTVQNTRTVSRVECMTPDLVIEQLEAVLEDIPPQAAKLGALGNAGIVRAIASRAREF